MSEQTPDERTDAAAGRDGARQPQTEEGRRVLDVPAFQYAEVRPPEDPTAGPAQAATPEPARPARRRGRPPGSRNRPRATPVTRPAARRRRARAGAADGSLDAVTAELVSSVRELANAVERQGRELADLRARMEGLRRVLE